jgi:hypothetical protein
MRDNDQFIDDLLGSALQVTATPRPGLEARVLTNLATARPRPRFAWFTLPQIAFASAAALALVFAIWGMRHRADARDPALAPIESASIPMLRVIPPAPVTATKTEAPQKPSLTPRPTKPAAARAETFPAPAELSEQERLVLAYLRRTPRSEVAFNSKPDPPREPEPVEMNFAVPAQHSTSEATK